jgi:localization factor PodJL
MKSGGPWNLRDLDPEVREAARGAARRSGLSVGEWLNSAIRPDDNEVDDAMDDRWPRGHRRDCSRSRHRESEYEGEVARNSKDIGELHARLDWFSRQIERITRAGKRPLSHSTPYEDRLARVTGAPRRSPIDHRDLRIDQAVAEITARQRELDGEVTVPPVLDTSLLPAPPPLPHAPPAQAPDLGVLEQQLRQITTRIEALRPTSDLETSIKALRGDLVEIGNLLTEALPRRAVESLEIEIKALAQRIDHSRQSGVDSMVVAGLERGLAEVRDALRKLNTAESLVGAEEAVKALAQKFDAIAAKEDSDTLHQLETAITGLRCIVTHVASKDALTKVAEEVRSLAGKIDGLANSSASGHALSALENRIDTLTRAVNASAQAGSAVRKELEKLLAVLIEKLEWVWFTRTDHAALAHLDDRIAMLVKRLDASDSRLGRLDGIERGLAGLLVHLEQMRGGNDKGENGLRNKTPAVDAIERDVAAIKQNERQTQGSPGAVQGTVEHVVDRLASIESDARTEKPKIGAAHLPANAPKPVLLPAALVDVAPITVASDVAVAPKSAQSKPMPFRPAAARTPIDPNLPPHYPLEPSSASRRSRPPPSAADRIAGSEATVGSKPPVIPDPGGKSDFIAAARRAAQATASASLQEQHAATSVRISPKAKNRKRRMRKVTVAAAVIIAFIGSYRIASRLDDGEMIAPPEAQTEKTSPVPAPPGANSAKLSQSDALPHPVGDAKPAAIIGAPPQTDNGESTAIASDQDGTITGANTNAVPLQARPDATGSLPSPPAVKSTAAPAVTLDDKLPAIIGGPSLRAAALAGDAAAAYEVAARFAEGRGVPQNSVEAARWLERAAKQGLAPAQFRLGRRYEKGIGVKKDLTAARDLYRSAADKGNGKAMHNLALLYAHGIDGPADYRNAAHWFRKAADCGLAGSQYNLGILYARGIGVEQNYAESYKWLALAANQGDKDAAKKRDEMVTHLDQQTLAAARASVQAWRAEPQPTAAVAVKAAAEWDSATPAAKPNRGRP